MTITKAQTGAVAARISGLYPGRVEVDFCMRYGNPSTGARVQALLEKGCRKILFFALYPQYAGATTGTANDQFFRVMMRQNPQPAIRTVAPYYDRPDYIDALALSVTRAYDRLEHRPDILVASYHGMPIRYRDDGDPYYDQCLETTRLLRERLGWSDDDITTSFQSRFGTEEWLKPYTVEKVAQLARGGKRSLAVIAPAFSADCIETLEEINVEIRDSFASAGSKTFEYIACLNDDAAHIDALVGAIQSNLAGWL